MGVRTISSVPHSEARTAWNEQWEKKDSASTWTWHGVGEFGKETQMAGTDREGRRVPGGVTGSYSPRRWESGRIWGKFQENTSAESEEIDIAAGEGRRVVGRLGATVISRRRPQARQLSSGIVGLGPTDLAHSSSSGLVGLGPTDLAHRSGSGLKALPRRAFGFIITFIFY